MKKTILFLLAFSFIASNLKAQTFDESTFVETTNQDVLSDDIFATQDAKNEEDAETKKIKVLTADENPKDFYMPNEPIENKKEVAEVERGKAKIKRIYKKGEEQDQEEEKVIFLYMDDFKMLRLGSHKTNCSMRFLILTNLDQMLTSFDARLTWPNMKTNVSYSNIKPNNATYIDYTLMGEGCYTMDKAPNIEVNRCRVKGMSQEQCASKIRWVK